MTILSLVTFSVSETKNISPVLNTIICRNDGYAKFNYLTEFIVTEKNHKIKKPYPRPFVQ
ncbi:MAG: hypothetical protein OJF59_002848 [Cytophagales bacterium]|nr:MAG: hypothetical protein OJF59_002848 [Cytophagales bacterium]